jgi:DNA-directed RNA polymerase omega subunit
MTSSTASGENAPVVPELQTKLQSTFHLVVVASQRAKQLAAGARPRIEPGRHRSPRIALLEVSAGLVSWSLMDKVPPAEGTTKRVGTEK